MNDYLQSLFTLANQDYHYEQDSWYDPECLTTNDELETAENQQYFRAEELDTLAKDVYQLL